jgi:hypothetical protein
VAVTEGGPADQTEAPLAVFAPDDRPKAFADVEVAVFEGEAVLFDVAASMVHHLNAVPAATWLCCDGDTTVADMIDELVEVFSTTEPADIEALTAGVHDSLARFAAEGLLVGRARAQTLVMEPVAELAPDGTEIFIAHDNP